MRQKTMNTSSRFERLEAMGPILASYCSHLRRRDCRPRTLESYADCLLVYASWLAGRSPLDMTSRDLESFRGWLVNDYRSPQGRRVAGGRQSYYVAVLRGLYTWCRDERLIASNPAADLAYPKTPKRLHRDILTPAELRGLLDGLDDDATFRDGKRDGVALRLMLLSGLRVSEAAAVELDDLNLAERELVVRGKGDKQRLVFIDAGTRCAIAAYLLGCRPVLAQREVRTLLVDNAGHPFNRSQLLAIVKRHAKRARIAKPITPHSLRRTFATLMLQTGTAGMNLKVISNLLGHNRLRTTARYTQVDIRSLTAVYELAHPRALPAVNAVLSVNPAMVPETGAHVNPMEGAA